MARAEPSPEAGGTFVAVVGPSGVGKDSLLAYAAERLGSDPRFVFVRRIVTRAATADLEDHDSVTPEAFADDANAGRFALHWQAHGLGYALPGGLRDDLAQGRVVIANISRGSITAARAQFENCRIVSITAPREVLAARLAGRGRESAEDVAARLARAAQPIAGDDVCTLDNGGALADAGEALVDLLTRYAG
ncbi:phosphonate metabolism protein/1,5-bisphosphokinase (PRPP-forming) PhnN [Breoghania sp. L-A4]|uniref:phosphonate metabolism protein/1,5-bisphosphokinase (PRPP-forming) PhnN n=1 Tax=Breoghania sp. L-A4 TaxID=2304600 RepID=UPI000E35DC69|nr:phosphonate metabolism protein/1,5-bisphosphokinase (PRPP-forming) PhnN [Breoghania sp. L-A4]AXS42387.1 phosphonate metabolism protein/1,5-bisphosphokinase (PRPP-forming) PhnN [Breoghania sp. L-A4]